MTAATQTRARVTQRPGQAVIAALRAEGVSHVFGLVGSHVIELYDALLDAPDIRHITVKHETTASGMADAWGRLTGEPGVCFVTAGPGATNSITGVAQAYMASSPLIHISGAAPHGAPYESFHGVDKADFLVNMFKDVTKWSEAVERPADIPRVLAEAFRTARSGRPGPVHIDIPQDVLTAGAAEMDAYAPLPVEHALLDAAVVAEIAARVRDSRRPLIWAGKGVKAAFADAELAELAELLEAPVILSGDAAGGLPDTHPLATGQLNLYGLTPLQQELARDADLVIAVGERGGTGFADAMFGSVAAPVVGAWTGNDGEQPDARAAGGANGVAHIRAALDQFVEALGGQQRARDAGLRERIAREGNGLRQIVLDDARARFGAARPMHYGVALAALADAVDDDTIVLGDIGSHNQWTRLVVETRNRDTLHPEGYWGAMGFALPAAMAAKLARPAKKVVGVTGDGCFLMASADFATAVENGLNPVVIILNDRQYGMIVGMQEGTYGRAGYTALDGPDFVAFARAFGGDGMRVESPEQMPDALARGFASEHIFVIDALCDHRLPNYDLDAATATARAQSG